MLNELTLADVLASQEPLWEVPNHHNYHAITHGSITGKLVNNVSFSAISIRGDIQWDPSAHALFLTSTDGPAERLMTNLGDKGLEPRDGTLFIKDWSEHAGLTASLVEAGVVEVVRALNIQPFGSRAYEVRVLTEVTAPARELVGA